ncbi:NFACT family protein [Synechocystis sp. LKSZ1]|uniref:Rqc2 family fibronectin-binding protein n=1 Tax=Synechocystis sp. LKSZ1 TaxID=3144951 RepID=UPI00336BB738
MQSFDFTTLTAIVAELRQQWLPARIEQVYQRDRYTLALALRTLQHRGWLTLCWHPQAARLCLGEAPPTHADTFTFSDQLRHQIKGLALTALAPLAPWERVLDLQVAPRPGEAPHFHLYLEIMGKYSNLVLTDAHQQIITVAHQVNAQQSRVRTVQTGQPYTPPPVLLGECPRLDEDQTRWQERLSLIPGPLKQQLIKIYRGVSPMVAQALLTQAQLPETVANTDLTPVHWQGLFQAWQAWLKALETEQFHPGWTSNGYTVLGQGLLEPVGKVNTLINDYYSHGQRREQCQQLRQQLQQKVQYHHKKLQQKALLFQQRLAESEQSEQYQQQADLLMAHSYQWQAGMTEMVLTDFETGQPVRIPLRPDKNAIQTAQALYRQHQKLKRAKTVVLPLLENVQAELAYLAQIEASLAQLTNQHQAEDLQALEEIREELIEQKYLDSPYPRSLRKTETFQPHQQASPSGFEVWIGRNNRQNDYLTFRVATDYDLWFHSQEIAGSHVLLRVPPGASVEESDLQCAADWAAYYSQARGSEQVPVIYTQPKYVFKPKGARPGMVVYQQEVVLWGKPSNIPLYLKTSD